MGDAPELTAEQVVDCLQPLRPVVSPDGRWVAYVVVATGTKGELPLSALWLAATDAGSPPRRLTDGAALDVLPRWAPDSASLWFGSDRTRRGVSQLCRIGIDSGDTGPVTVRPGALTDCLPLADGRHVAVLARDEPTERDERRRAERDDAMVYGERVPYDRLRLFDTATGQSRVVAGLGDRHVVEVAQRPDGGPLAVLSQASPDPDPGLITAELHVVDPTTGAVMYLGPTGMEPCSPVWWNDGGTWHVCYLVTVPPGLVGGRAVFAVAVPEDAVPEDAVAAGEHHDLTADMTCCPFDLAQVADGPPLALFAAGLDTAIHRLDPGTRRFRRLATWQGHADTLTASRSGEAVAAVRTTPYEPKEVHAGRPGAPLVRLSDTKPELRAITWGIQERLAYTASDGLALDGLLILPAGRRRDEGPFPLVTLVHGGPDARYADQFMLGPTPSGQWLATGGYAVFLPNPRGGVGHGRHVAAMAAGAVGAEEWTDIVTGIDLLIAEGVADPGRLGIGGWSHGGFLTAWAVGRTDRFKAALMGAGISDWGMLEATGENGPVEAALSGSHVWEGPGPHRHDAVSPVSHASRVRTPVLILHGENDTNVPVGQATCFHRALRHFGVPQEFVVYPREGHVIRERAHQLDLLRRTRAWFDRWLAAPM